MNQNASALYLVIDQGGQSSRALVFNRQGKILSQASVAIETFRQAPDRVEHSAVEILSSINKAIEEATATIDVKALECAGLACQRSSIVCWDKLNGTALSPVLSWQDRRAADTLVRLSSQADTIHRLTGLFLSPHYGASKIRWCLDHLSEVRDAHARGRLACGPLSSYILFNLLEEQKTWLIPSVPHARCSGTCNHVTGIKHCSNSLTSRRTVYRAVLQISLIMVTYASIHMQCR